MKIKYSVKFDINKRKGLNSCPIRMRLNIGGLKRCEIYTGYSIKCDMWNDERQRAIPGANEWQAINRLIEDWSSQINEIIARYELLEKRMPTFDEFMLLFNDMTGRAPLDEQIALPSKNVVKAFNEYIENVGFLNQWSYNTTRNERLLMHNIERFDPKMTFRDVTENKMQDFLVFCNRRNYINDTIAKHFKMLRGFLGWAETKGYYNGDVHKTFKPKFKGTNYNSKEIIYLTLDELRKLQEHQFTPEQSKLEHVRDVFVFCCFTGLRYSDVAKLRKTDIQGNNIRVVAQKTSNALVIELNKHSRAILDKYAKWDLPKDLALPVISNVNMNLYLKEVGRLAGIDTPTMKVHYRGAERCEVYAPKYEMITTHCARRTFVITALQLGIPSDVIMKWTGHRNHESMKPYTKIVDELKEREMQRFDTF